MCYNIIVFLTSIRSGNFSMAGTFFLCEIDFTWLKHCSGVLGKDQKETYHGLLIVRKKIDPIWSKITYACHFKLSLTGGLTVWTIAIDLLINEKQSMSLQSQHICRTWSYLTANEFAWNSKRMPLWKLLSTYSSLQ